MIVLSKESVGQVRDTTATATDSTIVLPADSLRGAKPDTLIFVSPTDSLRPPPVPKFPPPFLNIEQGWAISDSLPTKHPALDASGVLADLPGSFLFDFGASGWPDGWSPYGIAPHDVSLSYNGIPFDNSVVGTAAYELLPLPLLQPFHLQPGRFGTPLTVNTRLRALEHPRPLTEIRYRQSNNGLKSVLVFHSQQRRLSKRNRKVLGVTLAYGGHGANGEYAGSRLEGARQLLTRFRYQVPWASFELMNFSNRRRIGAHGGVLLSAGDPYEVIYDRFTANVENPSAQRQMLRNDLALTMRSKVLPDSTRPFTAMGYWTAGTFRYVLGDTLQARTSRVGYRLSQSLPLGRGDVTLTLEGWTEKLRDDSAALPDSLNPTRSALNLSAQTTLPLGPAMLIVEPSLYSNEQESFAGGRSRLSLDLNRLRLFAEASHAGQKRSWIQSYGWDNFVTPLADTPESRVSSLQAGVGFKAGPLSLNITGFVNNTRNYTDFFSNTVSDSISVRVFPSDVSWAGASAMLGLRKDARRGFYFSITPSIFQLQNTTASTEHSTLLGSLPEVYVQSRLGMRYKIFKGDLDFDLYGQARLWQSFQSRTLHPQTGLLVLRPIGSRPVDESVALDVVMQAQIRAATLFLAFENVLSSSVFLGNLIVPDYPLPAQRFRFGVYWPIQD